MEAKKTKKEHSYGSYSNIAIITSFGFVLREFSFSFMKLYTKDSRKVNH